MRSGLSFPNLGRGRRHASRLAGMAGKDGGRQPLVFGSGAVESPNRLAVERPIAGIWKL